MTFTAGRTRGSVDEHERAMNRVCEDAIRRLADVLAGCEVAFLGQREDLLVHLAHEGALRLIYEVPRELGGVTWRAVTTGELQFVPDVAVDPDYIASDEAVRSEIAAPVFARGAVIGAIDVESTGRLDEQDAERVTRAAAALGSELERVYDS